MTGTLRAVVDVNVLVSAVRSPSGLCAQLLKDAVDGRWQPVVSLKLLGELEDVLARPAFADLLGSETIDRFLLGLLAIAEWAEDPPEAPVATRDPDDDYLLALACSAQVDVLLSGDHDLTDLPDQEPPIETPAQFSQRLR